MKRVLLTIVLLAAWPAVAHAATPAPYAGQCGLPAAQPVWAEFGYPLPAFNDILGKSGVVVGVGSGSYGATMRAAGAATVYFDLNFKNRVGTTTAPASPAATAAPRTRRSRRRRLPKSIHLSTPSNRNVRRAASGRPVWYQGPGS